MRAGPRELDQVVDRRPQHTPHRVLGQRALGDHRFAMAAALEVAMGRRFLSPPMFASSSARSGFDGCALHDEAHVQRVRVPGHHVRADRVAGRERPHHVAHRPDDVRLGLPELRPARHPVLVSLGQPLPHRRQLALDPAGELGSLLGRAADEAGRPRDPIAQHLRPESARLRRSPGAAVERVRHRALGVGERHEDVLRGRGRARPVARRARSSS